MVQNVSRAHVKQENIWSSQYDMAHEQPANLSEYPERGTEVSAWKEGMQMERQVARIVGMAPKEPVGGGEGSHGDSDDDDGDSDDDCDRPGGGNRGQSDTNLDGMQLHIKVSKALDSTVSFADKTYVACHLMLSF